MNPARKKYLQSLEGDLAGFAALLGEHFGAKVNMLAQLLGDAHHPSLGAFKERILAEAIGSSLPERYRIGTGFVLFPVLRPPTSAAADARPQRPLFDHRPSLQCDLIVYDAASYPTIFEDAQFVVVRPEAVRAIIEVKGTLDATSLRKAVSGLIRFGRQWVDCDRLYAEHLWKTRLHRPGLFLMAWQVGVDDSGNPRITGTQVRNHLARAYKWAAPRDSLETFPLLHSAYVYNDYIVSQVTDATDIGVSHGYATSRGYSKRINASGEAEKIGDMTIGNLIASLQLFLAGPFNGLFAYFDQGDFLDKDHPHGGYAPWLFGDDVAKLGGGNQKPASEE